MIGKTQLASALAHEARLRGHLVLSTTAVDIINTLMAAQTVVRLKNELKHHLKPTISAVDELGYSVADASCSLRNLSNDNLHIRGSHKIRIARTCTGVGSRTAQSREGCPGIKRCQFRGLG